MWKVESDMGMSILESEYVSKLDTRFFDTRHVFQARHGICPFKIWPNMTNGFCVETQQLGRFGGKNFGFRGFWAHPTIWLSQLKTNVKGAIFPLSSLLMIDIYLNFVFVLLRLFSCLLIVKYFMVTIYQGFRLTVGTSIQFDAKTRRRCAPPFLCYLWKTDWGAEINPPTVRGIYQYG